MAVHSGARHSHPALARGLSWCGIAALGAGAWLAWPRVRADLVRAPLAVVLLDVSKSVVGGDVRGWANRAHALLHDVTMRAQERGDDVALVAFGRDVRTLIPPLRAADFLQRVRLEDLDPWRDWLESGAPDGARETRLAAALDLALTWTADRPRAHVAIVGDGTYTGHDPAASAAVLAQRGVVVEVRDPRALRGAVPGGGSADGWNLALGALQVPRAIEADAPLVVSVDVRVDQWSARYGGARVEFTRRDTAGETRIAFEPASLQGPGAAAGGAFPLVVHADLGPAIPGLIQIEARAILLAREGRAPMPDALPEDDVSTAIVRCAGSLVVGVVDAEQSGKPLFDLLSDSSSGSAQGAIGGVDVVALERGNWATRLATLDAVVTVDAPLTGDEERLLVSFVEHGGGWLDLPGWSWISARAKGGTPLAAIAALAPSKGALSPRDVVFLVDTSGSMSGAPHDEARSALASLVDAALPDDDVSVRFFAVDVSPPIRFGTGPERADRTRRESLMERVRTEHEPGGATRLWLALETLVRERTALDPQSSNRETLVLLLSDGQDPDRTNAAERAVALRAQCVAARMRIFALSPTEGADLEFLASLAGPVVSMPGVGADGQPNWSFVFRRELAKQIVHQRSNQAVVPVPGAGPVSGGREIAAPIARACGAVPPIDVAVHTDARAGAEVLWTGDDGNPLGAIARTGTGLVATLAFAPNTQWAPGWTEARTIAPLVRALARGHAERPLGTSLRLEDGWIVLEGVDAAFEAPAEATLSDASGTRFELVFGPGRGGLDPLVTRMARLPEEFTASAGFGLVRFETNAAAPLELVLPLPRAPEFAFERKHFAPPARAAVSPGRAVPSEVAHPAAPLVLLSGVLVLATAAFLGAFSRSRA